MHLPYIYRLILIPSLLSFYDLSRLFPRDKIPYPVPS